MSGELRLINKVNPVFICGLPRSGTSLLMGLLDGHAQVVAAPNEMHFFQQFLPRAAALGDSDLDVVVDEVLLRHFRPNSDYNQRYLSHIPQEAVQAEMAQRLGDKPRLADYLGASILAYGAVGGQVSAETKAWVEKTPHNERFAHEIFEWWPEAKCLHVLRDPRAILNTYRKWQPGIAIDKVAHTWRSGVRLAQQNQKTFGTSRYKLIHYETLVANLSDTMKAVAAFVGIEPTATLLTPTKSGGLHPWKGNSAHKTTFAGVVSQDSAERWRTTLPESEINIIEQLLASEMTQLNYVSNGAADVGQRLKSLPYAIRLQTRELVNRWRVKIA